MLLSASWVNRLGENLLSSLFWRGMSVAALFLLTKKYMSYPQIRSIDLPEYLDLITELVKTPRCCRRGDAAAARWRVRWATPVAVSGHAYRCAAQRLRAKMSRTAA